MMIIATNFGLFTKKKNITKSYEEKITTKNAYMKMVSEVVKLVILPTLRIVVKKIQAVVA